MEVMTMRRQSFTSDSARRALGVAGILGFVALALGFDANVLTRFHVLNTAKAEDNFIGAFQPRLGDEGSMPDLDGAIGWLNSAPLNRKSLRGKVVLVDFRFAASRTLPKCRIPTKTSVPRTTAIMNRARGLSTFSIGWCITFMVAKEPKLVHGSRACSSPMIAFYAGRASSAYGIYE
jgi:hypothetical protein